MRWFASSELDWINDYIGVPYRENGRDRADGWDCWGVVVAVYRERLGLELPDFTWTPPFLPGDRLRAFAAAVDSIYGGASAAELAGPETWALALVHGDRRPHHVGVAVCQGVLHAQRYTGTVYEPLHRFTRHYQRVKWFRWRR